MARAKEITWTGLHQVAAKLGPDKLPDRRRPPAAHGQRRNQETLKTSLATLTRVLDAVDWPRSAKATPTRGSTSTRISWRSTTTSCASRQVPTTRRRKSSARWSPRRSSAENSPVRMHQGWLRRGDPGGPGRGTGTFLLGVLRRIAERYRPMKATAPSRGDQALVKQAHRL